MKFCTYYFQRSRILGQSLPEIDFDIFTFIWIHIISRPESGHIPVTYGDRYISLTGSVASRRLKLLRKYHYHLTDHRRRVPDLPSDTYVYRCVWAVPPFPVTAIGSAASCKNKSWNTWYEVFKVRMDKMCPLHNTGLRVECVKYKSSLP